MPRLLTRMSTEGSSAIVVSHPAAVPLSATSAMRSASGSAARMPASALSTFCLVRPLTATFAPSAASERAMASPIPPDDAVTSATLPFKFSCIDRPPSKRLRLQVPDQANERRGSGQAHRQQDDVDQDIPAPHGSPVDGDLVLEKLAEARFWLFPSRIVDDHGCHQQKQREEHDEEAGDN